MDIYYLCRILLFFIQEQDVIEIRNLFNFRKSRLTEDNWTYIYDEIEYKTNHLNIDDSPKFVGDFVFFAWGTSKLKSKTTKEYAKKIFLKALKDKEQSEETLSFYHPFRGHWKAEKWIRFNDALCNVFGHLEPVTNFN